MWLGHTYTHAGDSEGAARSIERAVAEAEGVGDLATIGKSHYVMAREGFWLGNLAEGAEHGRRAVAALGRTGDWWWLAHSYSWTALNLCNLGRFEEALVEVARARAIGDERADPRIHSYSAWNAGWIQATRGEWEAAIADCTESLETSPDSLNSSYSMGWLGFSYREKGDMGEAIRHLEQSIALLTEFRYSRLIAWFKGWLSEAHLWAGDIDQALTVADQALRVARELRYLWGMALARRALGRIAMARGALSEAERHLAEALGPLEDMGARFDAACVRLSLAEAAARRGDAERARSRLGCCLADFDELRTPRWTDRALRLAGELGLEPPRRRPPPPPPRRLPPAPAEVASARRSGGTGGRGGLSVLGPRGVRVRVPAPISACSRQSPGSHGGPSPAPPPVTLALNGTRRGLGSGERRAVERLAPTVRLASAGGLTSALARRPEVTGN